MAIRKHLVWCLWFPAMVYTSAHACLDISSFRSAQTLATVKFNHTPGVGTPYYRVTFDARLAEQDHVQTENSVLTGAYSRYFNSLYIAEKPCDEPVGSISAADAHILFESCTDNSFKQCSPISNTDFEVRFNGNIITSLTPSSIEVTL